MKKLVLIRHAKSSWGNPSVGDIDRPLNDRGKEDAPAMAKRIRDRKMKPDALVSSPAKRAKQTAKLFADELHFKRKDIIEEPMLYEAGEGDFSEVVRNLENKWDSVVLFSHNPGITSFVNSLTETRIDDMPTCAMFAITIDTDDWRNFNEAKKDFLFFDYPKLK